MKTSTSLLSVNRLITSLSTLLLVSISMFATATNLNNTVPGNGTTVMLGVEYASLVASATDKSVFINWATSSEVNNNHFEVEKSTDMKSFKTVAMILDGFNATGTQTGKTYKFKEAAGIVAAGKTVYYRLKQVDNDNIVHYSEVMAVQMNAVVTVFPIASPMADVNTNKINEVENTFSTGKILSSKQSAVNAGLINMLVENNFSTGIFA